MNIYLINVLLTVVWGIAFLVIDKSKRSKAFFCILTSIQWTLISGLRGMSVSKDMYSYRLRFNAVKNMSWKSIFDNFYIVYVDEEGKDPGFEVFEKIIHIFTDNYHVYLFIVALIFFTAMGIWVYKNSDYSFLSMIIFDSFLYSFFALTGIRQTLATVLIVFIGGKYIHDRKFWKFMLVALIAFTVHKSAICFVPFYFVSQIPITRKYIIGVLASFPILFVFRNQFFRLIGSVVGYEYDALESTGAYTFTFMYLAVITLSLLIFNYIKENCEDYTMYFNALFMGLIFIPLVFVNPAAMRVVQYYSLYLMIFVPKMVKSFHQEIRIPVYVLLVAVLLVATSAFTRNYAFFWE